MPLKLIKRHGSPNFYIRGTVRGATVDETTGTADRDRAEALRAKRENELFDRSVYGERATATFGEAALGYLESGGSNRYLQPLAARWERTSLAKIDQNALDQAAIDLYPKARGDTRNRHVYTPAIAVLRWAAGRGLTQAQQFKRPKLGKGRTRYLDPDEAERFLKACSPPLRRLVIFLIYTGARITQAIKLDWRDIDGQSASLMTSKGKPRAVRLHPRVIEALGPRQKGAVFHWRSRWGPIKAWSTALRKAKIEDFTRHDCRHTFATWLRRQGGLDTLGLLATGAWSDPKSVARYAHATADEAQAAIGRLPGGNTGISGKRKKK